MTTPILIQWSGQMLRGEPRVQRSWEGSVIWDIIELERLRISDLSVLVCFGWALLLGKMCLLSTFHLDSYWSYLVLRKKTVVTAETASCELIFSFTCIDYNVKDSKSIHLNVTLEKKKSSIVMEYCQAMGKNKPDSPVPECMDAMVPIKQHCLDINNKSKDEK